MKRFLLLFLLTGDFLLAGAQNVQWASRVVGFSSEYSKKQYGSSQILGKPNVLPAFKDSPCAWSPLLDENRLDEYIHVEFKSPMSVRQIAIAESFNPGAISRIYAYDLNGNENLVYKNDLTGPVGEKGRMLRVTMPLTSYKVKGVKVILNTLGIPGWNHIDAIGISDSETPIEAQINLVENLVFEGEPENLGLGINSRYDEIMPIISPDGVSLYFDRKDHPQNTGGIVNDDIWFSTMQEDGSWSPSINLGPPLNNNGHNFLAAISPDGNTALLGNIYSPDGTMESGLSMALRTEEGWSFPTKLNVRNYYNHNKYSEFHLGADGKTIIMTIERDDSYGGKDLYVSFLQGGIWSEPQNLGPIVNTAGTEMSPFLAADGKTIYFSSNGFSGYGNKDMYLTRRLDNTWRNWTEPQNLGPMINSEAWDAYYSVPASGEFAYFSSEKNSLGKTDIFRIKLPKEMRPDPVVLVKGRVLSASTKQPLQARIVYETLPEGKEIGVAVSSPLTGEYTIVLPGGAKYGFLAKADSHLSVHQNLDLTFVEEYKEMTQDLLLVPMRKGETVVLNNIFFGASEADLTSDSWPELNRVVTFLKGNPSVKIEISGHTNNSCEEAFCIKLSTERAKAVYDYLVQKGIPPSRLTFKGYGSKKPIASNSTAEGKRMNRRVEFTITGI